MNTLDVVRANLLSPLVLAFVLGIVASLVRSDLRFPDALSSALSIYLLLAIGLKGGTAMVETPIEIFWLPALGTLALGVGVPIWSYALLRRLGRFDIANAASIAAHYGSVSAVTFSAALGFLDRLALQYEGFLPTLLALLEVPGIVVALLIARTQLGGGKWSVVLHEVLAGKSILLLVGGLLIGLVAGKSGLAPVEPLFVGMFPGLLTLFLLDLGLIAGSHLPELRAVGPFLVGFGVVMPLLHGTLGVALGTATGLSVGGAVALGIMAASASYIAAPAAVRVALPQANLSYALAPALVVTFPFNLAIGLPLLHAIAVWLAR